ncbi:MAG: hypothetical protein RIS79_2742 [Verrucomicrobiota bacterium]
MLSKCQVIPPHSQGSVHIAYTTYNWDQQQFAKWKTTCVNFFKLLHVVLAKLNSQIEVYESASGEKYQVEYCYGMLQA